MKYFDDSYSFYDSEVQRVSEYLDTRPPDLYADSYARAYRVAAYGGKRKENLTFSGEPLQTEEDFAFYGESIKSVIEGDDRIINIKAQNLREIENKKKWIKTIEKQDIALHLNRKNAKWWMHCHLDGSDGF